MASLQSKLNFGLNKSNLKLKLSGISGAFMLPIASMAITSLFLSVGGVINTDNGNTTDSQIGRAIQAVAFPLLQAFPLLICISFALAFTKQNEGIAVWCALLGYLTFTYFNSAFISCNGDQGQCICSCGKQGGCCQDGKCCLIPHCKQGGNINILWSGSGRDHANLIHRFFGVTTLNCSIFAPMIIGGIIIPFIFKRWSNIKLPACLAYFSGKRLLPLLTPIAVIPLALLFLVFWPWVGYGLAKAGNWIASENAKGVDAFFFGFLEKLLIPTGFHHLFASLFWYTPLGGDILLDNNGEICKNLCCNKGTCGINVNSLQTQGDALLGASVLSLPNTSDCFGNLSKTIKIGRFTQGKFPIMQFGLPAAALAIYFTTNKRGNKRQEAKKALFPGIMNSVILGITEPIEFSFMYSMPRLFYWFHTTMCGVSFLAMRLLEAQIPTAFSGGIIELLINGVIPVNKGTKVYWWAAVGGVLSIVYFSVFYYCFRYKNIKEGVSETTSTQIDNSVQEENPEDKGLPPHIAAFRRGLGGWDNVTNYKNCASRLRYDIKDKSKVIESELQKAGVIAVKWVSDNHVQLIVGPKAEEINTTLLSYANSSNTLAT